MANSIKAVFVFLLIQVCCLCSMAAVAPGIYNITDFGARPGLYVNNTQAIQQAINEAAKAGGAQVLVPDGIFVTGPLLLKNGVELHLANNAVLTGSTSRMDYGTTMALIFAQGQNNIAVTGRGVIDGRGAEVVQNALQLLRQGVITDEEWLTKRPTEKNRPSLIIFKGCSNVRVKGITLKNAACWVQNYKECNGVDIDSITVQSTAYWNNDGIDIVDSKNVRIVNSYFNSSDDAVCLKSESVTGICENVLVQNCTLRSSANGFKIGTGSSGGFKNIVVKDITVFDTYRSAIALETVDGAAIENVVVSGVKAKNTGNAIFVRLGHRNTDARYSILKNVVIENVNAEVPSAKPDVGYPMEGPPPKVPPHNLVPASITGIPGHPVQGIVLKNIEISYGGGASKSKAYVSTDSLASITNNIPGYPEFTMFGELPAWGLYIRHAEGIVLQQVKLSYLQPDFRPVVVADDVQGLVVNTLTVPDCRAQGAIVLNNVTGPAISNLKLPVAADKCVIIQNK